jgi:hypothetical protein
MMRATIIIFLLINVSLATLSQDLKLPISGQEQALFNSKNLEGWYQIVDGRGVDKNLFKNEGGVIHAYSDQADNSIQSFGALITDKEYENYVLSLEYKWGDKKFKPRENSVRDAGVLFHMYGESVIWPAGIECQIQEGDTGDLWIIKSRASTKVDPNIRAYGKDGLVSTLGFKGMDYNRFPRSYCWEKPGWNKVVLIVKGDHAQFFINDKLVNEAIEMKKWDEEQNKWIPLIKGKILLQAEGSEIFYRNVTLKPIKID